MSTRAPSLWRAPRGHLCWRFLAASPATSTRSRDAPCGRAGSYRSSACLPWLLLPRSLIGLRLADHLPAGSARRYKAESRVRPADPAPEPVPAHPAVSAAPDRAPACLAPAFPSPACRSRSPLSSAALRFKNSPVGTEVPRGGRLLHTRRQPPGWLSNTVPGRNPLGYPPTRCFAGSSGDFARTYEQPMGIMAQLEGIPTVKRRTGKIRTGGPGDSANRALCEVEQGSARTRRAPLAGRTGPAHLRAGLGGSLGRLGRTDEDDSQRVQAAALPEGSPGPRGEVHGGLLLRQRHRASARIRPPELIAPAAAPTPLRLPGQVGL